MRHRTSQVPEPSSRPSVCSLLPLPSCVPISPQSINLHAEVCFLYWFHTQVLGVLPPDEKYKITWYVSWSPCNECAEKVASFLDTHRNLSLAIFSSRLYYFWDPDYQDKLRRLNQAGAQIAAMDFPGEGWASGLQEGLWLCHTVKGSSLGTSCWLLTAFSPLLSQNSKSVGTSLWTMMASHSGLGRDLK